MDHFDENMPMQAEAISPYGDTPSSRRKREREHASPNASNPSSGAYVPNEANPAEASFVPNEANYVEPASLPSKANSVEPPFVPNEANDDSPKNGVSFEIKYT